MLTLGKILSIISVQNMKTTFLFGDAKMEQGNINYTDKMVVRMHEVYEANPTRESVDMLATELGKSTRSIIAKLSREGIYVPMERKTKTGEPVVHKGELVAQIEEYFGVEMPSLVKATKADLIKLVGQLPIGV